MQKSFKIILKKNSLAKLSIAIKYKLLFAHLQHKKPSFHLKNKISTQIQSTT